MTYGSKAAIVIDLDGTLYDDRSRTEKYLLGAKKDFEAFNAAHIDSPPNFWCLSLIMAMHRAGFKPVFITGREHKWFETTRHQIGCWIGTFDFELLMRPTGDRTHDDVLKERIYLDHVKPEYHVQFAVEDRRRVVDMWRRIGIPCLQCAPGEF